MGFASHISELSGKRLQLVNSNCRDKPWEHEESCQSLLRRLLRCSSAGIVYVVIFMQDKLCRKEFRGSNNFLSNRLHIRTTDRALALLFTQIMRRSYNFSAFRKLIPNACFFLEEFCSGAFGVSCWIFSIWAYTSGSSKSIAVWPMTSSEVDSCWEPKWFFISTSSCSSNYLFLLERYSFTCFSFS